MEATIYHNPRCSKSRATLDLLNKHGISPRIVEYLKTPPSAAELDGILTRLGFGPRDLMRKKEAAYAEAGLDDLSLGRQALIARMVAHPSVIERPIVVIGDRAAVGRPPEAVLSLLAID